MWISHRNVTCPQGCVARFICYTRKLQLMLHSRKISRECFDWKEDPQGEVIFLERSAKAGVLCKVVLGSHGGDAQCVSRREPPGRTVIRKPRSPLSRGAVCHRSGPAPMRCELLGSGPART